MSCLIPTDRLLAVLQRNVKRDFATYSQLKNTLSDVLEVTGLDAESRFYACLTYSNLYKSLEAQDERYTSNRLGTFIDKLSRDSQRDNVDFEELLENLRAKISTVTKRDVTLPVGSQVEQLQAQADILAETGTAEEIIQFTKKVDNLTFLRDSPDQSNTARQRIMQSLNKSLPQNQQMIPQERKVIQQRLNPVVELGTQTYQSLDRIPTLKTLPVLLPTGEVLEVRPQAKDVRILEGPNNYKFKDAGEYIQVDSTGHDMGSVSLPITSVFAEWTFPVYGITDVRYSAIPGNIGNKLDKERISNTGDKYRIEKAEITHGVTLKNHHHNAVKSHLLRSGKRPADAIRVKITPRIIELNRIRLDRVSDMPGFENRTLLTYETPEQQALLRAGQSVVTTYEPIEGYTMHLTDERGQYLAQIEFADRYAIVHPDNRTEVIDFSTLTKKQARWLQDHMEVRNGFQVSELTEADIRALQEQHRMEIKFKNRIAELAQNSEADEIEIPSDLFFEYFTLEHLLSSNEFTPGEYTDTSLTEFMTRYDNAAVPVQIVKIDENNQRSAPESKRIPLIYSMKTGLYNPLAQDEQILHNGSYYFWNEYAQDVLRLDEQMGKSIHRATHVLMMPGKEEKYIPLKMLGYEIKKDRSHLFGYFSQLPEWFQQFQQTQDVQAFNRSVYGFPIRNQTKVWLTPSFKDGQISSFQVSFTSTDERQKDTLNKVLSKLTFDFSSPTAIQAAARINQYFGFNNQLTSKEKNERFQKALDLHEPEAKAILQLIQTAEQEMMTALGENFNESFQKLSEYERVLAQGTMNIFGDSNGIRLRPFAQEYGHPDTLQMVEAYKDTAPVLSFNTVSPARTYSLPDIQRTKSGESVPSLVPGQVPTQVPEQVPSLVSTPVPDTTPVEPDPGFNSADWSSPSSDFDFQLGEQGTSVPLTLETFNEEVAYIRAILPEGIQIDDLSKVINDLKVDGRVLGLIKDRVIYLNQKLSESGTAYHEAFHAIFQYVLTPAQQRAYLVETKKRVGVVTPGEIESFRQARGLFELRSGEILDRMMEERLADGFRDYVRNKKRSKEGIFNRLFNFLKNLINLFTGKRQEIEDLYEKIDQGYYASADIRTLRGESTYALIETVPYIAGRTASNQMDLKRRHLSVSDTVMLKNRLMYELLLHREAFPQLPASELYDDIAYNLRKEFTLDNLVDSADRELTADERELVNRKYERSYTNLRYALGATHFDGESVVVYDDTDPNSVRSFGPDEVINQVSLRALNLKSFQQLKDEVLKTFDEYDQLTVEEETGTGEFPDDEEEARRKESEMGESYADTSHLEVKPSEGGKGFRRIFKYQLYEYTDPHLRVKRHKMVDGDRIYDVLNRILAGTAPEHMFRVLYQTTDRLAEDLAKSRKATAHLTYVPVDVQETDELLQSLNSVVQLLERQTGITKESPLPVKNHTFANQFGGVFYHPQLPVHLVQASTSTAPGHSYDKPKYKYDYYTSDSIQHHDNREMRTKLEGNFREHFEKLPTDTKYNLGVRVEKLYDELKSLAYPAKGQSKGSRILLDPTTLQFSDDRLEKKTDEIYSLLAQANLGIPRHAIYFSVMAMAQHGFNGPTAGTKALTYFKANEDLYNSGNYLTPMFFKYLGQQMQGKGTNRNTMHQVFAKAGPYLSRYSPTLGKGVITNAEGKMISRFVSYTPSLIAVEQLKKYGLQSYLDRTFNGTLTKFFQSNPYFQGKYQNFIRQLNVGVFNGFEHTPVSGKKEASSFGSLDDRSYILSLLSMFANRQRMYDGSTENTIDVFHRPITQFEATSTAFTVSSVYERYVDKNSSPVGITSEILLENTDLMNSGRNVSRITERLASIVRQEFERIAYEYDTRDSKPDDHYYVGYNAKPGHTPGSLITDLTGLNRKGKPELRAYHFNYLQDFFGYLSEVPEPGEPQEGWTPEQLANYQKDRESYENYKRRVSLRNSLQTAALRGDSFLSLNDMRDPEGNTLMETLYRELRKYADESYQNFKAFAVENQVIQPDGTEYVGPDKVQLKTMDGIKSIHFDSSSKLKPWEDGETHALNQDAESFLKDFHHNFWVNSLFVNQLFDGDFSQGIDSYVNYFKRQKSGAAAGTNAMSLTESMKGESARTHYRVGVINTQQFFLNGDDLTQQQVENELLAKELGASNPEAIDVFDGQAYASIDFRMMLHEAAGELDDKSTRLLKQLRYTSLEASEVAYLQERGILLNSMKTVTAAPQQYLKLSDHTILRSDVSVMKKGVTLEEVAALYDQADGLKASAELGIEPSQREYERIIRLVHSKYTPRPGREALFNLLNSMELHRIDQFMDETASKRVTRVPVKVAMPELEVNRRTTDAGRTEEQEAEYNYSTYLDLSQSVTMVDRKYLFSQVSTSAMHDDTSNGIQQLLLSDADFVFSDDYNPQNIPEDLRQQVTSYRQGLFEVAKSNLKRVQNLMVSKDGVFEVGQLYKTMERALSARGATANQLKFLQTVDGKPVHSPDLPQIAKMIEYYFFSTFNKALFAPKVSGKKFFHVSSMGYKLVYDKQTGAIIPEEELSKFPNQYSNTNRYGTRYPTVKKETTADGKTQYVVEVIVPKAIAGTPIQNRQLERIEKEFFGTRIPTEDKRSMVVARVVDTIDGAYYNSIIVPYQVHLWSGSDMDIDSLYAQMMGSYVSSTGKRTEYGDYSEYTDLGLSIDQGKFLEYLQYMATDPVLADHVKAVRTQLSDEGNYAEALEEAKRTIGIDLSTYESESRESLKAESLLKRTVAVLKALHQTGMPTSVQGLKDYGTSPVTPILQNEILKARMAILKHEFTYEHFLAKERSSAEIFAQVLKSMGLSETDIVNANNAFAPMGVLMARKLNAASKDGIGITASVAKGITLLVKANAKLKKPVWTLHDEAGQPTVYDSYYHGEAEAGRRSRAQSLIGNTLGMFADAAKRPYPSPLSINEYNTPAMSSMFAVGLPVEMAIKIHSVPLLRDTIRSYMESSDSVFKKPGVRTPSFNRFYEEAVSDRAEELMSELEAIGMVNENSQGQKEVNYEGFKISFDKNATGHSTTSELGFTIRDTAGNVVSEDIAQLVLTERFGQEIKVASEISFGVTRLTDAQKSLKPDFDTFDGLQNTYESIQEKSLFDGIDRIFNQNPVYQLLQVGLKEVDEFSKDMFLKRDRRVKGLITQLRSSIPGVDHSEMAQHVVSYFVMQQLSHEMQELFNSPEQMKASNSTRQMMARSFDKMRKAEFWFDSKEESIAGVFRSLQNEFYDNEFVNALELKTTDSRTLVQVLQVKPGLTAEFTENVIDAYLQLFQHPKESVRQKAVDIFVYALMKDSLITEKRKGSLLKVMPADMIRNVSVRIQQLGAAIRNADPGTEEDSFVGQMTESLQNYLKRDVQAPQLIEDFMLRMLNYYKPGMEASDVKLISNNSQYGKFKDTKSRDLAAAIAEIIPDVASSLISKVTGIITPRKGTLIESGDPDLFTPNQANQVQIHTHGSESTEKLRKRVLKHVGIYPSGNKKDFHFPLIKFNKFGQMLVLKKIDNLSVGELVLSQMRNTEVTGKRSYGLTGQTALYQVQAMHGNPDVIAYGLPVQASEELNRGYYTSQNYDSISPVKESAPVQIPEQAATRLSSPEKPLVVDFGQSVVMRNLSMIARVNYEGKDYLVQTLENSPLAEKLRNFFPNENFSGRTVQLLSMANLLENFKHNGEHLQLRIADANLLAYGKLHSLQPEVFRRSTKNVNTTIPIHTTLIDGILSRIKAIEALGGSVRMTPAALDLTLQNQASSRQTRNDLLQLFKPAPATLSALADETRSILTQKEDESNACNS